MESKNVTDTTAAGLSNLSKRQQVAKANRMIFVWVALASVVVVTALVFGSFLVRQALFNQKIINQKSLTNKTITQNIDNAATLKQNVDRLLADNNLASVRSTPDETNFKVIFDALPTTGDTTTLTNTLYSQIFSRAGVTTDSILTGAGVMSAGAAVPAVATTLVAGDGTTAPAPQAVPIQASISGNKDRIVQALKNVETVVRPMNVGQLTIEVGADNVLKTTLLGESYYVTADSVKLGTKQVKP